MDKTRKRCIILTPADLSPENINATVQTIEHNLNGFYLLEDGWKTNLWEIVEQLGKISDNENILTVMRIAYDLKFDLHTELKTDDDSLDGVAVKSLAELLELLDLDENLYLNRTEYHIIINDDSDAADIAVTKLFQQMAFLNLDLDIRKKSVAAQEKSTRPVSVALLCGSHAVGKSVIIDNLIKRDYTPTSAPLATPNTIKYVPAPPDSKLKLEYDGETIVFESAEFLKNFIGDEFHRAMAAMNADWNFPDMTIYYPCDDLKCYEVWETPYIFFPTFEHAKIFEECIKAVDVCIFVMNYANHLSNDEVRFLKTISEFLRAENKMSYVVFVVNQVDLRYNDCEEKSIPRLLDYIQTRLEIIGYENPVIFGTSALQGFYLDQVVELVKEDRAKAGEDIDALPIVTEDSIRPLKRRHRNVIPQLSFVGRLLDNLDFFHSIENPTERELYALSGIPQLRRYVDYLGEQAQRRI